MIKRIERYCIESVLHTKKQHRNKEAYQEYLASEFLINLILFFCNIYLVCYK